MSSILITTPVENLQQEIIRSISEFNDMVGIYVSLNKTQRSTESFLSQNNIDTSKLFFIDCVTSEKSRDDVLHIEPSNLNLLSTAIESFMEEIHGTKFLVIDAITTLLIYNEESKVAQFVKHITDISSRQGMITVAFTPETKGEDLLKKIFNFFDEVQRK